MPQGNYNYDAGYIMSSDKTSVDDPMGSNQLNREGLQFDTRAALDVFTQDDLKNKLNLQLKLLFLQWLMNETIK